MRRVVARHGVKSDSSISLAIIVNRMTSLIGYRKRSINLFLNRRDKTLCVFDCGFGIEVRVIKPRIIGGDSIRLVKRVC